LAFRLASLRVFRHLAKVRITGNVDVGAGVMLSVSEPHSRLKDMQAGSRGQPVAGSDLLARTLAGVHKPRANPNQVAKIAQIERLIASQAWVECALALVELELPQWKLRRLIFEDGRWLCSLSRQWNLPDWLDDAVEARHESLPLAILGALIAACRSGEKVEGSASSVLRGPIELSREATVCCDNFA
jgi:hypothetical protein